MKKSVVAMEYLSSKPENSQAELRLREESLTSLSYQLRTSLTAILGWAQLLQTQKLDDVTTALALETIERNARVQAQLLEDQLEPLANR